mgnify:FL=1|tara:strand:- start:1810 stop:2256 length:447 start_codon:yes stop_codon:yes gene_type:complete
MAKSFNIRPLELRDRDQWQYIWGEYLKFYETKLPIETYSETFYRLTDSNNTNQNCLVAHSGDTLYGLVHYIYHAHNWKTEDVCYLQDLFTLNEMRRQGIAKALIKAVYEAADTNGTPSVYWMTQEFNQGARKLYDQVASLTPFIKYQR